MPQDDPGPPDPRPPVWVGHVTLATPDIGATRQFFLALGMRDIEHGDGFAVLELRGGTHLVLLPGEGVHDEPAAFDLMVDDLEGAHRDLESRGLSPSPVETGSIHDSFTVRSPSGHRITFHSSHASGLPV
jgi:catechol 2,3-dioxygenase-like lactoylglutathione lyase family enzyme